MEKRASIRKPKPGDFLDIAKDFRHSHKVLYVSENGDVLVEGWWGSGTKKIDDTFVFETHWIDGEGWFASLIEPISIPS